MGASLSERDKSLLSSSSHNWQANYLKISLYSGLGPVEFCCRFIYINGWRRSWKLNSCTMFASRNTMGLFGYCVHINKSVKDHK